MSYFSSHADKLRAKLQNRHSPKPADNDVHRCQLLDRGLMNGGFNQPDSSFVSPSYGSVAAKTPANLIDYRDKVGQTFSFTITGSIDISVWGTNVYTDDSSLAAAAVHAGAINDGQTKTIDIEILPGMSSYQGSIRNGITSSSYGIWEGSYSFLGIAVTTAIVVPNLKSYRNQVSQHLSFPITGSVEGSIWGTDVYTDDSNLAVAAVHAGVVNNGQTTIVNIQILPGQSDNHGTIQNEVTSMDYGAWEGSYIFTESTGPSTTTLSNLKTYRDKVGQAFSFTITGRSAGSVWGTHIYTDDSNLAAAAVHAGVVRNGETNIVNVHILPGQPRYQGIAQNGVTSSSYGIWQGSYSFVSIESRY